MATTAPRSFLFSRPVTVVFVGAMVLRLFVLSRYGATPYSGLQMGDMKFYHAWAVRILHGQLTDGHAFYGLPGYAYLLAGFYWVLGSDFPVNWMVIGVLQSVCEALTAVLIFKIARLVCTFESKAPSGVTGTGQGATKSTKRDEREGDLPTNETNRSESSLEDRSSSAFVSIRSIRWPSTMAALAAALGYVLFVPAQVFSIILMPTAWLVCAYWWCVWQGLRPSQPEAVWRWLGLGALVGVVAMMIATILFAIPMLLAAIALQVGRGEAWAVRVRRALLAAVLLVAGVLAGTSPAWIHNYFVAHDPVLLSAHGGLNFWMGNNPVANGYPKIPSGLRPGQEGLLKDSILRAEEAAGHPLKRMEVSRYWSAQANAYIHEHPVEWVRLIGTKIRNFWNGFQYDDISVITLLRERGVTLPGLRWGFVAALGLAGMLVGVWGNVPARWVSAAVLLHMGALLSVFITERYRLAAAPGLIILSAYVLWRLWGALVEKRWPLAGGLAGLLAVTTLLTSWPAHDPALWSLDPYNLGVKELEVAEGFLAEKAATPEEAAASKAAAERELGFAEAHLKTAYGYLQGNAGIVFALGNLAFDRGDRAQAQQWYERTLAIDPHYASALKNLGFLKIEKQEWAAAADLLEQARQLEPENATTFYQLARAKNALGDREAARDMLKEALRMKPQQPEFLELARTLGLP